MKPLRKDADTKIDKKALNDEYREKCTKAISVKNCGIYRRTADQIYANLGLPETKLSKITPQCGFIHLMEQDTFHLDVIILKDQNS